MDDIFETDDKKSSSLEKAAQAIRRAAGRMVLSIIRSTKYLNGAAKEQLEALLSPASLWTMAVILAAWIIATVIGGPFSLAVNTLLGVYGLYQLYEQLAVTWQSLKTWARLAYNARNDSDLDAAAKSFADAMAQGGLAILEALITHKIFKSVEGGIRKRYPPPKWVESEYAKAFKERRQRPVEEETTRTDGTRRRPIAEPPVAPPPVVPPPDGSLLPTIVGAAVGIGLAGAAVYGITKLSK